ncbi:unnamed protein product [Rotaria sp. Silwood2]|nr:unnamed protein product [Rotaria sp. Silwood2]
MNHQDQYSKVHPLINQHHGIPASPPTPRRTISNNLDNIGNDHPHTNKRTGSNEQLQPNQPIHQHQYHHNNNIIRHHNFQFSFSVLKRAVANFLPSYFIVFDASIKSTDLPSSTQVAIMLKKLFIENRLHVKEISMCTQAGERRFKFAVSKKLDFLTLFDWSWPNEIDGMKFKITKPHSLPDCLALVVRYIPTDIKETDSRMEIMKAIPAAVSFSTIRYQHRHRPSYDLRFCVRNLDQYKTALELGRLAIGHHYLPLTYFMSGYRLTYCTSCWKIGHLKDKCHSQASCRKCLTPFKNGENHVCHENSYICAQCGDNHFSLSSICPVVKQYKKDLKAAVEQALAAGTITCPRPGEPTYPIRRIESEFPELSHHHQVYHKPAWQTKAHEEQQFIQNNHVSELADAIKALSNTMAKIEKNLQEMNRRIEEQYNSGVLHNNSISTIIDTLQVFSRWVNANNSDRTKLKKNITNSIDDLQELKQKMLQESYKAPNSSGLSHQSANTINSTNNKEIVEDLNEDHHTNSQEQYD